MSDGVSMAAERLCVAAVYSAATDAQGERRQQFRLTLPAPVNVPDGLNLPFTVCVQRTNHITV